MHLTNRATWMNHVLNYKLARNLNSEKMQVSNLIKQGKPFPVPTYIVLATQVLGLFIFQQLCHTKSRIFGQFSIKEHILVSIFVFSWEMTMAQATLTNTCIPPCLLSSDALNSLDSETMKYQFTATIHGHNCSHPESTHEKLTSSFNQSSTIIKLS